MFRSDFRSLPIRGTAILFTFFWVAGCATPKSDPNSNGTADQHSGEREGFSLSKLFFGKKKKDSEESPARPTQPSPRKVPVGTIHLVHGKAKFVLIQSSRMTDIPEQAELITYSADGKPTGKLRISPERKGAFLVADILGGSPNIGDRVMLFGMVGADGKLMFDPAQYEEGPEVLD